MMSEVWTGHSGPDFGEGASVFGGWGLVIWLSVVRDKLGVNRKLGTAYGNLRARRTQESSACRLRNIHPPWTDKCWLPTHSDNIRVSHKQYHCHNVSHTRTSPIPMKRRVPSSINPTTQPHPSQRLIDALHTIVLAST